LHYEEETTLAMLELGTAVERKLWE